MRIDEMRNRPAAEFGEGLAEPGLRHADAGVDQGNLAVRAGEDGDGLPPDPSSTLMLLFRSL